MTSKAYVFTNIDSDEKIFNCVAILFYHKFWDFAIGFGAFKLLKNYKSKKVPNN